eukprot:GHRQ01030502.1.p1 GENE.GHRQ01030502.1~~GHRQ01030502.1.p1  ORF type:complete len:138 (+),score=6.59 GHRQ01030502.1:63-476(+)
MCMLHNAMQQHLRAYRCWVVFIECGAREIRWDKCESRLQLAACNTLEVRVRSSIAGRHLVCVLALACWGCTYSCTYAWYCFVLLQVPVWDDRFRAVQALRLVGYMLSAAGFPCPVLWDPQDPPKKMYGRYDKTICAS